MGEGQRVIESELDIDLSRCECRDVKVVAELVFLLAITNDKLDLHHVPNVADLIALTVERHWILSDVVISLHKV